MLPQEFRLPLKRKVKFSGHPYRSPDFTLLVASNHLSHPRLGVVIPKSTIKLSTHRHRLVRQLHGEFIRCIGLLPPLDLLLIVKSSSLSVPDFTAVLKNLEPSI